MADNPAMEIASTLQTAHINPSPDITRDANPSTTASKKSPVRFRRQLSTASSSSSSSSIDISSNPHEIPLSLLEPIPSRTTLPPLPDLRFEQSYLARIKPYSHPADGGPPDKLNIAWYTFLDHVLQPLMQGMVWNLALHGWRAWNVATKFKGRGIGAKVRRWWWGVNNWNMPNEGMGTTMGMGLGLGKMGEIFGGEKVVKRMGRYYDTEFGGTGME